MEIDEINVVGLRGVNFSFLDASTANIIQENLHLSPHDESIHTEIIPILSPVITNCEAQETLNRPFINIEEFSAPSTPDSPPSVLEIKNLFIECFSQFYKRQKRSKVTSLP